MFVYGRNSVEEALEDNLKITHVLVDTLKEEKFYNLIRRLRDAGVTVKFAKEDVIAKTARTQKHQGIAAEIMLPSNIVEHALDPIDWTAFDLVVALDGITDTGNLGAILRSALLLGVDAVVLPLDNSARITPQVIKASAGAVYRQQVYYVDSLNKSVMEMQAAGLKVYAMMGQGAEEVLTDAELAERACVVIGSEREGIRKSVKKLSDVTMRIPTTKKLDSLNASVSAAVTVWEFARRMGKIS